MKNIFVTVIALTAVFTGFNAFAKVTLEDVYKHEAKTNNAHLGSAPVGPLDPSAHGIIGGLDSGDAWQPHWSGSTTGRISIPSSASEVFIMTSEGSHTIPRNAGHIDFGKTVNFAKSHSCNGGSVRVNAGFNGGSVWGGSATTQVACETSSGRNYTNSRSASITIYKVMVR